MPNPAFLDIPFCAIGVAPTPTVTPTGADNSVTRTYKLVAIDANGNHSAAGSAGTDTHGATVQSVSNFETLTWTDAPGMVSYDVYRTVGAVTGKIGNVLQGVQTLVDTGLVGDSTVAPTTDTSGFGTAKDIGRLEHVGVQVAGTFVGTIQLQGSLDSTDGSDGTWFSVGTAATGAATVVPLSILRFLRAKCTAYTSGTPVITAGGHL